LRLEEELDDIDRRVKEHAGASERYRERQRGLAYVLDGWGALPIAEKQSLLRDLLDRVVVLDEEIEVVLSP
jgi:hypothetical protein